MKKRGDVLKFRAPPLRVKNEVRVWQEEKAKKL